MITTQRKTITTTTPHDERRIRVLVVPRTSTMPAEYHAKTRVYIDGAWRDDKCALDAMPTPSLIGDDPENDAAWKRFNRAEVAAMRAYLPSALRALHTLHVNVPHARTSNPLRHSRKAGCSCGCSPGFVYEHTMRVDGQPVDVFVTVIDTSDEATS